MSHFAQALADIATCWPAFVPPNRVPVSEGARVLKISRPGGGSGPWRPELTPYMIEPTDMLASRRHSAVCFVGPAQTGKTVALGEAWLTHVVTNDPGDMLIVQMTQDKAREYSRQRIDRAIRNTDELRALLGAAGKDDNLHDKSFRNGMMLKIGWPTVSNLSSTSYRNVFGTDYDRWPDDIDGEGDGFTLMGKRITTFGSRGMVSVESSPGRPIEDPSWTPATPHEAPPVKGILGIYNRSDRRRYYWQCPHCQEYLQATPGLGLFRLPSDNELLESIRGLDIDKFAQQYARGICPKVGCVIKADHRERMNRAGRWLQDGLTIDHLGRISGNPRTSSIAGFWLGGVAATYVSWEALIRKHLQALLEYALTGSELPLLTTTNTDQGVPYLSRHLSEAAAGGNSPADRADPNIEQFVVPEWTRFIEAAVDIQGGKNARFIVQVHAIGEHQEQQLIDRYAITLSERDGYGGKAPLDPAGHAEDWDLITERVVKATYRTPVEGREMRVKQTLVDTGGEDGVTLRAYAWWRRLRAAGLHRRVVLTKGAEGRYDWLVRETMVGGPDQKRGDVPLHLLNSNQFKDAVAANLRRTVPGPGYYHFPMPKGPKNPDGWLLPTFFDELSAEVRQEDGKWTQIKNRNEALDCCYMIRAGCVILGADKAKFWQSPPAWARPLAENVDVIDVELRRAERAADAEKPAAAPLAELKKNAAPQGRRQGRSGYLG